MKKYKNYSKQFKFKVALEMIRGDLTTREIISKYQVPESVAFKWKKQMLENGAELFDKNTKYKTSGDETNAEIEKLHSTIGRLKVEKDFLREAYKKLKL